MSTENTRVGENIRAARTRLGLTQQNIADRVGVTKQTICKIEKTGSTNPQTLERIAEALHVDVHELYEPPEQKAAASEYADFTSADEQKLLFIRYIKPMVKELNDTTAKNFYEKLKQKCRPDASRIESVSKVLNSGSQTYSHEQVGRVCNILYTDFLMEAHHILLGVENKNPWGKIY